MRKNLPGEVVSELLAEAESRGALLVQMAELVEVWGKALDLQTLCRKTEEEICAPRSWTRIDPAEVRGAVSNRTGTKRHNPPKSKTFPEGTANSASHVRKGGRRAAWAAVGRRWW